MRQLSKYRRIAQTQNDDSHSLVRHQITTTTAKAAATGSNSGLVHHPAEQEGRQPNSIDLGTE